MTATLERLPDQSPAEQLTLAESMRRAADWLEEHPGLSSLVQGIYPSPVLTLHFTRLDTVRAALRGCEVTETKTGYYRHYSIDVNGFLVTALGEPVERQPEEKFTL